MKKNIYLKSLLLLCLSFSFFLVGCNGKTMIVNSVPEREANEIVVLLASKGIDAEKTAAAVSTVGGGSKQAMYDISVPAKDITEALAILNQGGFPRAKGTSLLDLFGEKGIVPSAIEDRIRYQEGLSEQLAMTIRKMDGIIDANVQITFPSTEEEEEEKKALTASVYVKHQGILDNPNSLLVTKIKRLIASAIPGLSIENVSVVTDRSIYSDIALPTSFEVADLDKRYVSIWTILVAKETAGRFRFIFYLLCLLVFLLSAAVAWMIYKFYPIIANRGGIKALLNPHPFKPEEPSPPPSADEAADSKQGPEEGDKL